jgi:uncharacterized protein YcbK (DUF882 family)
MAAFSNARRYATSAVVAIIAAATGVGSSVANSDKERTLNLFNIHNKETLTIIYKRDGKYVPEALEQLNWIFRDWRLNEATKMDPAAFDLLWEIHTELGSREAVHIISGYRSRKSNELLRRTVGGQASESRHILGKAMDVHFPDVSAKKIRYSALVRERGGVGYYPTSALPFVHIDTDRVRHWPRMPRMELALLFPSGKTQHQPADGPLTRDDAHVAQARYPQLAQEVAEFMSLRGGAPRPTMVAEALTAQTVVTPTKAAKPPFAVAALSPPVAIDVMVPRLVSEPRLVDRPSRLTTRPTDAERGKLAELAALASSESETPAAAQPRLASLGPATSMGSNGGADASRSDLNNGWAQAPAFDEEHPDELSYRPFPLAPYLTQTASPDDPALAIMTHPDVAKTLELLDQAGSMPPMKLRPGAQVAQLMWAQQFQGGVASTDELFAARPDPLAAIPDRRVKTAAE